LYCAGLNCPKFALVFGSLLDDAKRAYLIEAIREGMRG
jgi:hypothetical protein